MIRSVWLFDEADPEQQETLGNKGAVLAAMKQLGLPVPEGFTITTTALRQVADCDGEWPGDLRAEILACLQTVERRTGRAYGDPERPLFLAVRSGASVSMPGMMDTVLNLGLNERTIGGLARQLGSEQAATRCYQRLLAAFGDTQLPPDPLEQLQRAVQAVARSWHNPRAAAYRRAYGISDAVGTAVTVQAMVFGNSGVDSGTGVLFTRNPTTGEEALYGEFLADAQGEELVAGMRTPEPLSVLQAQMPSIFQQLGEVAKRLEEHFGDMQDIEFTVEKGSLYLLQTRSGKRTTPAAVKIAVDLCLAGRIDRSEALRRVDRQALLQGLQRRIDPTSDSIALAQGIPATPGAVSGPIALDAETAIRQKAMGVPSILVRRATEPDDFPGILAAAGVLTAKGGSTSHAAVVTRPLGKPCVVGCAELAIDFVAGTIIIGGQSLRAGDWLTLDGDNGQVFAGSVPLLDPVTTPEMDLWLAWSDHSDQ